ncbi:mixed lineage kinase domain-like protein [Brachyhypopomus gauderio]|uniref:mixed lineage kinase domain-like protein n=1 Tax=Brachyhypopomus gauderio TaxID=698409 RepID=UPI0040437D5D
MDLIEPILGVAERLYSLCGEVKANKQRCMRLANRVTVLANLVRAVKNQGLGKQPEMVHRGLQELKLTLESAEDVVRKYASSSYLKRIVKAYGLGEEFGYLNERLNDAAQLLSLAFQVEQREKINEVFNETTRKKEDAKDRSCDYEDFQTLLKSLAQENQGTKESVDAVHLTVQQTQKEVQDIKCMLESLTKPSVCLPDIREIRPDELTYDLPIEPIMTSDNSEVFKGEYNKFTVAIKRYINPSRTNPNKIRRIFNKEVETMKRFESPHILRMFGICLQNEQGPLQNYLIVMEYCEKGSLRQVLDKTSKLLWDRKIRMCLDAAHGLYRLHQSEEKFKVHGCITSSKFLVAAGYRVKLGGFELSQTETSLKKNKSKTTSLMVYASPQQLQNLNHPYDKACEIYSFGIVLWEITTQLLPFKDCPSHTNMVCKEKKMEPLPKDCPGRLGELINACRSYEPFHRPNAGVIVDQLRKLAEQYEDE